MKNLNIETKSANYKIYFENNFGSFPEILKNFNYKKICIVSDSNVSELYLDELKSLLHKNYEIHSFVFPAGEKSKNLDTLKELYLFLINNHFDRKSALIALGGGVVGDLTGFAASTYMRGIDFIQVPTTLLSQIDSSVGGKVGVDFSGNKNLVGSFYQPKFVFTNINTLLTLDKKQFSSGMAEAIKHGLIKDYEYYKFICDNKEKIIHMDFDCLSELVFRSCEIKNSVVSLDERDLGIREILNFGHSFGHAVETLSNFELTHGHSVAIGMICSSYYALTQKFISEEDFNSIKELLNFFELENQIKNYSEKEIISQMYLDKKTSNNVISIITLRQIGEAFSVKINDENILADCIRQLGV